MRVTEHPLGIRPADAFVGDGNAIFQLGKILAARLIAGFEVAFDHNGADASIAGADLFDDILEDGFLSFVILVAVGMAAVDHDPDRQAGLAEHLLGATDVLGLVVGTMVAAAQHDMHVAVPGGGDDGVATVIVDTEKVVGMQGGVHGIDGDLQIAVGAVLETDGKGKTAGHFSMDLGFGGASADRPPADGVGQVMGGDRVEHFAGDGKFQIGDGAEQAAADAEPLGDLVGAVEVGIVDQPLPANGGARLFEVEAHDQEKLVGKLPVQAGEAFGVFEGGPGVVDGAGADDHHQPGIFVVENVGDLLPGLINELGAMFRKRKDLFQVGGGDNRRRAANTKVVSAFHGFPFVVI